MTIGDFWLAEADRDQRIVVSQLVSDDLPGAWIEAPASPSGIVRRRDGRLATPRAENCPDLGGFR